MLEPLSKPPLNLLLGVGIKRVKRPWELKIDELLKAIEAYATDFRICGSAVLNSSILYRLKVESLFKVSKPVHVDRVERKDLEPPTILDLPYRFELQTLELEDMLRALEELLGERRRVPEALEPLPEEKEFFDLAERVEAFKLSLLQALEGKGELGFREYVQGMDMLEVARVFIILLFLAQEGLIRLEEVDGDLKVIRVEGAGED